MSLYTCFDWFKKLRLFVNVRNLKINVVLKVSRAVVIGWFSLNLFPIICLILKKLIYFNTFLFLLNKNHVYIHLDIQKNDDYLRIDRNFCSVHEEITSIRLYTPCKVTQGCIQPTLQMRNRIKKIKNMVSCKCTNYSNLKFKEIINEKGGNKI
jgi:hypothetical protein